MRNKQVLKIELDGKLTNMKNGCQEILQSELSNVLIEHSYKRNAYIRIIIVFVNFYFTF